MIVVDYQVFWQGMNLGISVGTILCLSIGLRD